MNLQFQYPFLLWLLLAVPLLVLLFAGYLLWKRKAAKRIGDPGLVKELYKTHSPLKAGVRFFLLLLSFSLGCIAVANPRRPDATENEVRKGIDVLIALDVSNSMLASDVTPNRLEGAKALIGILMDGMPDNRIGLVVFAGNAYVQLPLTFDHNAAQMFVSAAGPGNVPSQGTALSNALEKCSFALGNESGTYKAIVLLTDGETHDDNAVLSAQKLAQKGIMINTIGIGSPEGATIFDAATGSAKRDASGNIIVSRLNEKLLQQVAAATKGAYIPFQKGSGTAAQIMRQLSSIERSALGDTSLFIYKSFYVWALLPALLLLVIELFVPDRKKETV